MKGSIPRRGGRTRRLAACAALTAAAWLAGAGSTGAASAGASVPTRGSQLYATNFDPSTFNQTVVGTSASLTQGPGPSLVCTVGSAGSKMIASARNVPAEPTSIWAEYDIKLDSSSGQYVASFYFEGIGGNHRHLHIDYSNNTITLRDPNYHNEGPLVSVSNLNSGATFHIVVVDTSPRYRVYVNSSQVIDFTDGFTPSTPGGFGLDCASQSGGTGSDSVSNFSLYTVTGACAAGWSCADIGSPTPAGTENLNGSTWTVRAGGSDIQGTSDRFHFVWQALPGNGSVSARVASQTNTSSWAKAGVMVRATADPGSPNYAVLITPRNGVVVQYRALSGGGTSSFHVAGAAPVYLRITRNGTSFSAYTSGGGATWTLVPNSTHSIGALGGSLVGGLAVTSHNSASLCTATFDAVSA